ncbi:MAG: NUDIX domain-containing protein [Hyphomicrobium sp.]|jgi:8-oxo-dGTP pyrophosphatase MutT (NUDIX family)|nr:NUDIX domain-containing protein [Hyphomicrobium sp.]
MIDPDVRLITECILKAGAREWEFARSNARQIDAHWQRRSASNPAFFNGRIFMLADYLVSGGIFEGELMQVEFKQFLYWKDTGYPDKTVFDVFGSGLIRSRDGAVLLGRQRPGNLNEGFVYLPGGFIDPRDTDADGHVDIRASVLREVEEETGLGKAQVSVRDGFLVTTTGQQISIAVDLVSGEDGPSLQARVRRALSVDGDSELDDVILVRATEDLAGSKVPAYADMLLRQVLVPSS